MCACIHMCAHSCRKVCHCFCDMELRKSSAFNPRVFDIKAADETLLQVHWPLIYMSAFLIIHCACVCVSGTLGPVMASRIDVCDKTCNRCSDGTAQHVSTRAGTHKQGQTHTQAHVSGRKWCVTKHRGVYHFDGVMEGTGERK